MVTQKQVVEALLKPEAYKEETGKIELKQTHISFVFLTKNFVYKVKKAVDFGFLDYSTLDKRRVFCEKELILNRRLCGDMYLEVVAVTKSDVIRVGDEGEIVEYAVKMRRIPEDRIMTRLLEGGKVDRRLVDKMAKIIAEFHKKTSKSAGDLGSLKSVETNWRENFEQTEDFVGRTISRESFELIRGKVDAFMEENRALFAERVADGRVRECHGDIHSGNIFIADRIYVFDAIEFNERFSNCDVASEVAFLAMDLDFKGRSDLSSFFVEKYVKYSGDKELQKLLAFYKCYRAYVRGKVTGFKLNDPSVDDTEKDACKKEASAYFELASRYAKQL